MEIMAFDEIGGLSQIILEAIRGYVAHRPQDLNFLKKSLEEIVGTGGREAVLVTAEVLFKVMERSVKMKNRMKSSNGN